MSYESDLDRALQAGQSASLSAKKSAAKSPNALVAFIRDLGLEMLADTLKEWIFENWATVSSMITAAFGL